MVERRPAPWPVNEAPSFRACAFAENDDSILLHQSGSGWDAWDALGRWWDGRTIANRQWYQALGRWDGCHPPKAPPIHNPPALSVDVRWFDVRRVPLEFSPLFV